MKQNVVLDIPEFQVGDKVNVAGRLFVGPGEVVATYDNGEVSVKCPGYHGPKYGARSQIRYNIVDLAAGKVEFIELARRAAIEEPDFGDEDEDDDFDGEEGKYDDLLRAANALVSAIKDLD